ncbi:hypothetical protein MG293_007742 [Ovis ammon polii]|uniref:Uncharacterized protein n=1 Tax=Ovis ammon polii TaxID=230172 RepID=A0AAD4UAB8_OVIAM|nr:hypothetical protein MG293_007742 [Ovis ammon polii]
MGVMELRPGTGTCLPPNHLRALRCVYTHFGNGSKPAGRPKNAVESTESFPEAGCLEHRSPTSRQEKMKKDVVYEPDLIEVPFTSVHIPLIQLSLKANLIARKPGKGAHITSPPRQKEQMIAFIQ